MKKALCCSVSIFYLSYIILSSLPTIVGGLGSSSTIAVSYGSSTVCGILAQGIQCFHGGQTFSVQPNISYEAISGGRDFLCALTSGGSSLFCWDTRLSNTSVQSGERVYHNVTSPLTKLTVGNDQVCALQSRTGILNCWRRGTSPNQSLFSFPEGGILFLTITSGEGFSCGIVKDDWNVLCWGESGMGDFIESQFGDMPMLSLVAGKSHVCGISMSGGMICKGKNDSGQLDIPLSAHFHYSELALGGNYTCALQRSNGSVVCWGGEISDLRVQSLSFESIAAGTDFMCGRISETLTCWGWGGVWSAKLNNTNIQTRKSEVTQPISSPPLELEKKKYRPFWAYEIFGIVGIISGLFACCYFVYLRRSRSSDNVKEINSVGSNNSESVIVASLGSSAPQSRSSSITQVTLGRERSWDHSSIFTLYELALATKNFSLEKKIGKGSFGTVYKGRLGDGREVAIKREEIRTRKERERDHGFESELSLLSRVHHKHLVGLVGFCEENNERVLVYEYMSNGALYDQLYSNIQKSPMNSWKMRIKIALDAARGIEYLHNYAVPPIIHRDIKTSNILLDSKWVARVSDFGLSLKGPEGEEGSMSIKAVGTVGYIDPEYYVLKVLTTKSDVYGFGVVLLELVTGKKAVFKEVQGWGPTVVVDFAGPFIMAGQVWKVLDERVDKPVMNECEAVDILAYTAMMCVNLEGKQRPTMSNVVSNLERALALCKGTSPTFSPTSYSFK